MSAAPAASPLPPPRPGGTGRSPPSCPAAAASALWKTRGGPAGGLERGGPGGRHGAGGAGHRPRDHRRPRLYGSGAGSRRVPAVRPLLCSRRRRLGPAPAVPPGRSRDRFGSQADGPLLTSRGFSKPSEESGIFRSFLYIRSLQDLEMSTTLLSAFYDIDFLCKVGKSAFSRAGRASAAAAVCGATLRAIGAARRGGRPVLGSAGGSRSDSRPGTAADARL